MFTELERAAAARHRGIHGRFVLVCNRFAIKKELKGRRGWTGLWGKQQIADASIGEGNLLFHKEPTPSPKPPFREKSPSLL